MTKYVLVFLVLNEIYKCPFTNIKSTCESWPHTRLTVKQFKEYAK